MIYPASSDARGTKNSTTRDDDVENRLPSHSTVEEPTQCVDLLFFITILSLFLYWCS